MEVSGPRTVPIYEPGMPPEMEQRPPEEDGAITKVWMLWRERRLLWGVAWKTAIASAIIALLLPVHYDAVVKVVPGESSSGGMAGILGKLAGAAGGGLGMGLDAAGLLGTKTPGAFYVEVLKSRTVQDRIIDRFDLRRRYSKLGRWFPSDYYKTRKKLKSFTDIDDDKKSNVITVTVTDYDPIMAARIANAYIEELNKEAADLNTGEAHRERVFLEGRLQQAKQDLDQASLALSKFSSKNTMMDPQTQGKAMMDAAAKVQGEIIATQAELKGLEQIYSEDNVRVRTLRARLGVLQGQLAKITGKNEPVSGEGEGGTGSSAYPSLSALPLLGYSYSELYRQAKIRETVYEFLTQQYELAKIQEAKELPTVRVMDRAAPPERKSGPIRSLVVILSVLGALCLAGFWIIGKNEWEQIPGDDPRRLLAGDIARELRRLTRRSRRNNP